MLVDREPAVLANIPAESLLADVLKDLFGEVPVSAVKEIDVPVRDELRMLADS